MDNKNQLFKKLPEISHIHKIVTFKTIIEIYQGALKMVTMNESFA